MPRYEYKCSECLGTFTVRHSIKETISKCEECESEGTIKKIPTSFMSVKPQSVGKIVKNHIEEIKQDLRQEKKDLKNQEYLDEVTHNPEINLFYLFFFQLVTKHSLLL